MGGVEDSAHCPIARQALVERLALRGYPLRRLQSPEGAGDAVQVATNEYLSAARNRLIRRRLVSMSAAETLISRLGEVAAHSVLTGKAGSGKTACVIEVVEALKARGWPVLAFRLDRMLSVSSSMQLGHSLDLEESPALVLAAAAEATGCPAY